MPGQTVVIVEGRVSVAKGRSNKQVIKTCFLQFKILEIPACIPVIKGVLLGLTQFYDDPMLLDLRNI